MYNSLVVWNGRYDFIKGHFRSARVVDSPLRSLASYVTSHRLHYPDAILIYHRSISVEGRWEGWAFPRLISDLDYPDIVLIAAFIAVSGGNEIVASGLKWWWRCGLRPKPSTG